LFSPFSKGGARGIKGCRVRSEATLPALDPANPGVSTLMYHLIARCCKMQRYIVKIFINFLDLPVGDLYIFIACEKSYPACQTFDI
jgi:hypothetical protein